MQERTISDKTLCVRQIPNYNPNKHSIYSSKLVIYFALGHGRLDTYSDKWQTKRQGQGCRYIILTHLLRHNKPVGRFC